MYTSTQIAMLVVVALLGHTMALFWYLADRRNSRLCRKTIYDVPLPKGQLRRELINSVHTPIHAVMLSAALLFGFFQNTSGVSFVLSLVAMIVWAIDTATGAVFAGVAVAAAALPARASTSCRAEPGRSAGFFARPRCSAALTEAGTSPSPAGATLST